MSPQASTKATLSGRRVKERISTSILRLRRFSSSARSRGGAEPSPRPRSISAYDSPLASLSEAERTALHALLPQCICRLQQDDDALLDKRLFTPLSSHSINVAAAGSCLLSGICNGQGFGSLGANLESISYKTCAMLIKAILQDMPQSLLVPSASSYILGLSKSTVSSHPLSPDSIHGSNTKESRKEYIRKIRNVLAGVPSVNLSTLGELCALFRSCAVNIDSLSYMFGPLCMLPKIDFTSSLQKEKASANLLASAPAVANLMQYFIENGEEIFTQDVQRKLSSSSTTSSCGSRKSSSGCDSITEEDNLSLNSEAAVDMPEIQRKFSNSERGSVHSIREEDSPIGDSEEDSDASNYVNVATVCGEDVEKYDKAEAANPFLFSCRALYNYEALNDAEISISVGDVVAVEAKCMDGWWFGHVIGSDQKGLFPGSFLEEYTEEPSSTSSKENVRSTEIEAIVALHMNTFRKEFEDMRSEIETLKSQLAEERAKRQNLEERLNTSTEFSNANLKKFTPVALSDHDVSPAPTTTASTA